MKKHLHIFFAVLGLVYFSSQPTLAQWTKYKLSFPRTGLAATGVGNKVFFAGGFGQHSKDSIGITRRVDILNIITRESTIGSLSQARFEISAISLGGKAFFAGGSLSYSIQGPFSDRVDIYDDQTGLWTTATLSQARRLISVTTAGTKVFFAGGVLAYNDYSNVVDIYDIATGLWSTDTLSVARGGIVATSIGTKAFFAAGIQRDIKGNNLFSKVIEVYDTATGLWTVEMLPQTLAGAAATSVGTKAFFAGELRDSVYIYNDATHAWSTAALSQKRAALTATTVGTKVFFAGGQYLPPGTYIPSLSDVVDIYDNATDQWTTDKLSQARINLASTSLGNYAFFAGGELAGYYNYSDVVDIYSLTVPLPVNLIFFSGVWTNNVGTQLTWQTSLETNNDYFDIQRSSDAKSFETVGRVKGKGTVEVRTDYSFSDANMPGKVGYYRLKQVDLDGSTHLSNIISVDRQDSNSKRGTLTIGPVPTFGTLTLQVSTGKFIREVEAYDLYGRRLISQAGPQTTVDVSSLPEGVYLLDVSTTDGQRLHTRFVKQ